LLQDGYRSGVAELEKDAFNVILGNSAWLDTQDLLGRREYFVELLLILFSCETLLKVSDLKSGLEFGTVLN
jgi:hypothetical protein